MTFFLFNSIAIVSLIFIVWWFWFAKTKVTKIHGKTITIHVKEGVYSPSRIEVHANQPITLNFIREDPTPCSEYVIFDTLDIHEQLPLNTPHPIKLKKLSRGKYVFTCQMHMYQGELIVT